MTASRGNSVDQPPRTPNTAIPPPDFRAKLYQNYASLMDRAAGPENGEAVRRTVRVFRYHFREWLPADCDRAAPILDATCGAGDF